MKTVYMDHGATTPVLPEVLESMLPYFTNYYGNPSSVYEMGRSSRKAVEEARVHVADLIGAGPGEIIFTSGGTEADHMAIYGVVDANQGKGNHIITSAIEHHAVLHTCAELEKKGYRVTYLPVSRDGLVRLEDVKNAITNETFLISIMHANNEVGTIQPVEAIGRLAREKGIVFHCDGVQSVGKIPVNVKEMQVDLLSLSAHKIHGPKGVGALYIRENTPIRPVMFGGAQERKWRPGTENVPGIVGLGKAAEVAQRDLVQDMEKIAAMRDRLLDGILKNIDHVQFNGNRQKRIPGNINVCFKHIEGESLLLMLDMKKIAVSSGSACTSGSTEPSHVLMAMGVPMDVAFGSLRLTLGKDNTMEDVDYVLQELPLVVEKLRAMSPVALRA